MSGAAATPVCSQNGSFHEQTRRRRGEAAEENKWDCELGCGQPGRAFVRGQLELQMDGGESAPESWTSLPSSPNTPDIFPSSSGCANLCALLPGPGPTGGAGGAKKQEKKKGRRSRRSSTPPVAVSSASTRNNCHTKPDPTEPHRPTIDTVCWP